MFISCVYFLLDSPKYSKTCLLFQNSYYSRYCRKRIFDFFSKNRNSIFFCHLVFTTVVGAHWVVPFCRSVACSLVWRKNVYNSSWRRRRETLVWHWSWKTVVRSLRAKQNYNVIAAGRLARWPGKRRRFWVSGKNEKKVVLHVHHGHWLARSRAFLPHKSHAWFIRPI